MQKITEESDIHKDWYKQARHEIDTTDQLKVFIDHLLNDYEHDYGTICHAIAAAGLAAMRVVDADSAQGGITGFQASCVMWQVITDWKQHEGPMRLLQMEDMLYPQHIDTFTTISKETWEHLQKKANEKLNDGAKKANTVELHMQSIVNGVVPFGYKVIDNES